ncbi:unnamed protein product [Peronospora belbahrii]|uniref:Uncharacterized protein n=1 Tax=Peronospora belbahrii TaxID=622444 RepID=A0AAU9L9N8_9STRA|nr:unnamed protein product [Peronospora belbahrii]
MVSTTSILTLVTLAATAIDYVQAHGYIYKPKPYWKTKENSEWVVEIPPPWKGGWDESKGDEGLLKVFKELAPKHGYKDLRTLMDGDPLYGDACGYTDPKGKPVDPPTDGTATFSRCFQHAGPCAIFMDNKLAFESHDCQGDFGRGSKTTKSIMKPVKYELCAPGGCMMRFYWLGLQRLQGKTLWQAYKNCIPLTGPPGGGSSGQSSNGTDSSMVDASQTDVTQTDVTQTDVSDDSSSKSDDHKSKESQKTSSDDKSKESQKTPSASATPLAPETPSSEYSPPGSSSDPYSPADTPAMAPAPSSKCKGHRRRH